MTQPRKPIAWALVDQWSLKPLRTGGERGHPFVYFTHKEALKALERAHL